MGPLSRAVKRAFDVLASLAALVVAAPAIALIAIAVRLESRGPALYTQRRVGRDGRPFEIHRC